MLLIAQNNPIDPASWGVVIILAVILLLLMSTGRKK